MLIARGQKLFCCLALPAALKLIAGLSNLAIVVEHGVYDDDKALHLDLWNHQAIARPHAR
jgi:hypothetical protein